MNKIPLIIDCDPGHDDAMAIMWALAESDRFELLGVTTVAGNQTIDKVTRNALRILTYFGRTDVPVAKGTRGPMLTDKEVAGAPNVHGKSGLDGPDLPEPGFEIQPLDAVHFLIDTLENSDRKVVILPVGPLTNIAKLFIIRPDLKAKIERLSIMGGGTIGNWTPAAEFNIWVDPDAARIVFNSGVPITMAGLDVTEKAYVTLEENEVLRSKGTKGAVLAAELIDFFGKFNLEVQGFAGCTLHDPVAFCALVHPEIFKSEMCGVDVETKGELTAGMTVIDKQNYLRKIMGRPSQQNVEVLFGVDREKFVELFIDAMNRLN